MSDIVLVNVDLTKATFQDIQVNITFKPKSVKQEFLLPIWTPGSYKIRDHVQYLYELNLKQGNEDIKIIREDSSSWSAKLNNLEVVIISYRIEARELTVRTSYLDSKLAIINLCNIIMLN